jgi:hypothetical protein
MQAISAAEVLQREGDAAPAAFNGKMPMQWARLKR